MLMRKIPLIKPYLNQAIRDKVLSVLDSGYLTEGPVTRELEHTFKLYTGAANALAFTSCTTGLETALRAVKIGPGDEIIIPDYTYPATANVVNIIGATAIIVDVDPGSMLIDYDELEKAVSPKTRVIMPVSLFGNPLDYDRLNLIKKEYGLHIIEDAACSIGASFQGKQVGSLADISVFSMHPRKFITTGEGGMLTTDNTEWANWIQSYKHFGLDMHPATPTENFYQTGTNYKLSDLLAAIGLEQMCMIDDLLKRRIELADNYKQLIKDIDTIKIPLTTESGVHSFQSFCIFINNRDQVMQDMREKGIEVQIGTYALHQYPVFSSQTSCQVHGEMKGSKHAYEHALTLPLFHELTNDDQEYIVQHLSESIKASQ